MYTIQPGDTLWSIAARFGVSIQSIIAANPNLNPHMIHVGQNIVIPGAGSLAAPAPHPAPGHAHGGGSLNERVSALERSMGQLEEIVVNHRRQIADLQRRVGTLEQGPK